MPDVGPVLDQSLRRRIVKPCNRIEEQVAYSDQFCELVGAHQGVFLMVD